MCKCNNIKVTDEDIINSLINNGLEKNTSDLFRDMCIKTTYCNNESNLTNSINFKKTTSKEMFFRALQILDCGFLIKVEQEIDKLINWDDPPRKIDKNPNIFAPIYTNYKLNTYVKTLNPICDKKIFELEKKYSKKLGLQIFNFEANISEKYRIIPDHTEEEYGFHTSIFFEITKFNAKVVII